MSPTSTRPRSPPRSQRGGVATDLFLIGDGEDAKTLATVDDLCSRLAAWGLLRGDAVVALGGGVVGDTAGFAAAVYHRGVAVVQAPTTLLAQVDAAIGGKTAVNLPEGKNLVGAFHQPIGVLADIDTLATLPTREYRAGLGEVAKYALMPGGDARRRARRTSTPPRSSRAIVDVLAELVAACAAMKAAVVAADPQERTGLRATLNLGHTLGARAGDRSAATSCCTARRSRSASCSRRARRVRSSGSTPRPSTQHRNVVAALGLPTAVPGPADRRRRCSA